MRLLGEEAAVLERLGEAPGAARLGMELDGDHETSSPDLLDVVGGDALEELEEVGAEGGGVVDHALLDQHLERRPGDRTGQRVAAERGAVVAGVEDVHVLGVGDRRGHRVDAPAERLADDEHVGPHVLPLAAEDACRFVPDRSGSRPG